MFDRIEIQDRWHIYNLTVTNFLFYKENTFSPREHAYTIWNVRCQHPFYPATEIRFPDEAEPANLTGAIYHI